VSTINLSGIPDQPIRAQLSGHIESGMCPEDAAHKVLAPYEPSPLALHVWPFVLKEARDIEGRMGRRVMSAALVSSFSHDGVVTESTAKTQTARIKLRQTVYRLPDGTRVLWDDLTTDELDVKIAWMRTHIGSLADHLRILERARSLMVERGADKLGDIDGWVDLVAGDVATSSAAVAAIPKPRTGRTKAAPTAQAA
jgi:hypothetical protein